jgi:hypothetical protein
MRVAIVTMLACLMASAFIAGCGESGGPDPKVVSQRLVDLTAMRSYYDKANGNFDSLSADDRAAFVKLCGGDEAKAMTTWNAMKYGPGGPPK